MDNETAVSSTEATLYCALELSKNSWLLAIQFPDRSHLADYGSAKSKLLSEG
jgi:hypothetical protein